MKTTYPIDLSILAMKSFPPAAGAVPAPVAAGEAPVAPAIPGPPIIVNKPGASWRMTSCAL